MFSRQELLGTVEVVHLTGIKCMYIFVSSQAFTDLKYAVISEQKSVPGLYVD